MKKFREPCGCGKAATYRIETTEAIYYRCNDCAKKFLMLSIKEAKPALSKEHKKVVLDILTDRQRMLDRSYILQEEEKIHAMLYLEGIIREVSNL